MPTLGGVETSYKCGGPAKLLSQQWTSIPSVLQSRHPCSLVFSVRLLDVHVWCAARELSLRESTNRERRKKRREESERKPRDQRREQWTGEAGRRNSIDGERINNTELVRTLAKLVFHRRALRYCL